MIQSICASDSAPPSRLVAMTEGASKVGVSMPVILGE